jgi:hypothetical protein
VRSACDSERPTTVTYGQSWSLGGCKHDRAQSTFALVRTLETSPKLVVRGKVELPTFRFSGWADNEPRTNLQPTAHDPRKIRRTRRRSVMIRKVCGMILALRRGGN